MNQTNNTRDRLLKSARDLFYARSYGHVGVKEICDMAGVQKGSFYHFFPSKQELTLALLDEYFAELKANVFARAFRPELTPLQRLSAWLDNIYEFQKLTQEQTGKTLGCPYGNIASELSTLDETIRQRIDSLFIKLTDDVRNTLEEAVQKGDIPPCDTAATATAMLAYLEGVMLLAKTRNDPEIVRRIGDAVLHIRIGTTSA
ncbi:TetR/AcrR family transcriptional regulator [Candidatus Thiothrix sp. Deng01]|uniref:TetR/AcrR family transcriptional regulator n=1 Tax=Candidatus Thiothrix phosphatis TaxID=3112415 RepID=A0ABU6CYV3_9GAMM|nr:TetR/AcrR family transcriptional regulator [Candidatus Thiothrix sp. Deng01]MEB4592016.1 TetR/AcrR family transcriptional regulator [Candidatus Thiothrix sp. Deng01]